jgi:hypothetical protein
MGPPSYIRSVVDRNVVKRRIPCTKNVGLLFQVIFMTTGMTQHRRTTGIGSQQDRESFSWQRGAQTAF